MRADRTVSNRTPPVGVRTFLGIGLVLVHVLSASAQNEAKWDWAWGELIFGRTYPTTLEVTNKCESEEKVVARIQEAALLPGSKQRHRAEGWVEVDPPPRLSATDLLSLPAATCEPRGRSVRCEVVVPPGKSALELVIATPPTPDLRTLSLPPDADPHEWFEEVDGVLSIFSPDRFTCIGFPNEYFISGHVHLDPNPPALDASAPASCRQWWETGTRPPGLTEDCTEEFRQLATSHRIDVLEPLAELAPLEWDWLPSTAEIQTMIAGELLAMKVRADTQRRSP
jgi:hypothetical protein